MVHLTSGEARSFKNAETFEIMSQGMLYIKLPPTMTIEQGPGKATKRVKNRNERIWIPLHQIKDVEIITNIEITDPEECRKYDAFKKHGIDMTMTATSYTAPPDPKEVERLINQEEGGKSEKPTN